MYFDMPQAIGQFELFAGAAYGLHGQTIDFPDAIGIVHREPLGVCAQIIPWNVPILMMACKIGLRWLRATPSSSSQPKPSACR